MKSLHPYRKQSAKEPPFPNKKNLGRKNQPGKKPRSEEPIKGGQIKEVTLNEAPIKEVSLKTTPVFAKPEIISADIPQRKYNSTKVNPNKYSSKDFFATENIPILIFQIRKLIESEAPISKSLLCKKGSGRMGNQPVGTTDRSASGKDLRQPSPLPYHIRWSRLLLER